MSLSWHQCLYFGPHVHVCCCTSAGHTAMETSPCASQQGVLATGLCDTLVTILFIILLTFFKKKRKKIQKKIEVLPFLVLLVM